MHQRNSNAAEFYNQITSSADPLAFLRSLYDPSNPTVETEWLDFKGAEKIPDHDLRKEWSTALSGFANTEGGVVIWGIDARKDKTTGIDAASGPSLAKNPSQLRSRLAELHHTATDPPVLGVELREFPDQVAAGHGYVVCLVPESAVKPHRAENVTTKPYYIPAGDSFLPPSTSLLRHLIFPHP